jgi:hypothetical protein
MECFAQRHYPTYSLHQEALTSREERVLGITLDGRFAHRSGPSLVVESGNWTAFVSYFLPFRLSLLEV